MIILAGAFVTFLGFLAAGLVALVITAVLDKSIGKERALLLWAVALLGLTAWQCTPAVQRTKGKAKTDKQVPSERLDVAGDPFARPGSSTDLDARNPFQKHSDTRPLPPIGLEQPPWPALAFALPPTVPGPAPGARRLLRGEPPVLESGDGSTVPAITDPEFKDYVPTADDVYDQGVKSGHSTYVYLRAIKSDGTWYKDNDPRYHALKWALVRRPPGWEELQVEWALVGNEETAAKYLEPTDVLKKKSVNVTTGKANQFDAWVLRSTVDNEYTDVLRRNGISADLKTSNISALQQAAEQMAEIGRTGKEDQQGWKSAVGLLERALVVARATGAPGIRAAVLEKLIAAYAALRDEKAVLASLAEFARVSPNQDEPWRWLGDLYLKRLGLPDDALAYYREALDRSSRSIEARMGEGDALTALGRHAEALVAYKKAGASYEAKVRQAEAHIRLGDLRGAEAAIQIAMGEREHARALIAHGAILYAGGETDKARDAFAQAATLEGDEASELRGQAFYNLGLACWRLGEADASLAAFEACDRALSFGASPRRFQDEAVSPAFGRALIAMSSANQTEMQTGLQEAREEAPGVAYHDMLAGMVASREGNDAQAVRAFTRALRGPGTYPELDGWLARTRLNLALQAVAAGTPPEETTVDFEAAVAFAARAAKTEESYDQDAFHAALRECWIRIHAQNVSARQRFEQARAVADRILRRIDPEQPGALTLRGYCNYRLAAFGPVDEVSNDPYDPCIRDFQAVLNKVAPDEEGEWAEWRDYAGRALESVKHWRGLEEKVVTVEGTSLPPGWESQEPAGVKSRVEDNVLGIRGRATRDGNYLDPTVMYYSDGLLKVGAIEEIRLKVRIPTRDQAGTAMNIVTFGVEIQRKGASRRSQGGRPAGVGVFYDRGKVAVRFGGGREERFKTGKALRIEPEMAWPSDEWVEIRVVRENAQEGRIAIYLDADPDDGVDPTEPIAVDVIGSFKGTGRAAARFALLGWSTQAQDYQIEVKDLRIIRRKD